MNESKRQRLRQQVQKTMDAMASQCPSQGPSKPRLLLSAVGVSCPVFSRCPDWTLESCGWQSLLEKEKRSPVERTYFCVLTTREWVAQVTQVLKHLSSPWILLWYDSTASTVHVQGKREQDARKVQQNLTQIGELLHALHLVWVVPELLMSPSRERAAL